MRIWRDPQSFHVALVAMAAAFLIYLVACALGIPIEFLTYSPY